MALTKDAGYGRLQAMLIQSGISTFGRVFIVIPTTDPNYTRIATMYGPDSYDGKSRLVSTLEEAYALATSNANDVILLAGYGTHTVSTGLTIAKNRLTIMGIGDSDRLVQQGSKIQNVATDTAAFVLKNTGVRNNFINLKVIQASTEATALTVFQDGGEGALFKNMSVVFGVANNLNGTTAHEFLAGSDSATYINCTFGCDTLLTSGARSVFHIDQVTSGQEFKSNILENCNFIISSSSSTATFVRLDAVGDILFTNTFKDCTFTASIDSAGGAAIATASQTGTGTVKGGLYYVRPAVFNVSDFSVATNGWNANTQVVAAVSVAAAIEGIKPTA